MSNPLLEEYRKKNPEPMKGSDAYLRWTMGFKRYEQAQKAVDNSQGTNGPAITPHVTVTPEVTVPKDTHELPPTITPKVTVTPEVIASTITSEVIGEGYVVLQNNWFRLDCDIIGLMGRLSDLEFKIYLFMVTISYGQWKPKNICSASLSAIAEGIGVKATPPISKNVKSLITKGLLQRIFRGDQKGEVSIYRVFLPSEVPWIGGKTRVRLLSEK